MGARSSGRKGFNLPAWWMGWAMIDCKINFNSNCGPPVIVHPLHCKYFLRSPLRASWQFWLGNCVVWFALYSAQSFLEAFDGASFSNNLLRHTQEIAFAVFAGLLIHRFFCRVQTQKLAVLIAYSCLLSLAFAAANTLLFSFSLVSQLANICQPSHPRAPDFYCGHLANQFGHSASAMLIWQLCYLAIKSEHKYFIIADGKWPQWPTALGCIVTVSILRDITFVIGWSSDVRYLFSISYFRDTLSTYVVNMGLASLAFLIYPTTRRFNSRLTPWMPALFAMAFFSAAVAIMLDGIMQRIYLLLSALLSAPDPTHWNFYWVLFGEQYGPWSSRGHFAGTLQGHFTNIFIFSLVYLCFQVAGSSRFNKTEEIGSNYTARLHVITILYWSFFSALIYATDLMGLSDFGKSVPSISTYSFIFTGYCLSLILHCQVVVWANQANKPMRLGANLALISLVAGCLLTCSLWLINFIFIYIMLDGYELDRFTHFVQNPDYVLASFIIASMTCGLWCLISYMAQAQRQQRDATIAQMQLQMSLKEVQLAALAGKIDPHFIFNALNNIRALIDEDKAKARQALVVLSELLRSPLHNSASDKICIKEELQLVNHYVSLAQIHLEERLNYQYSISEDAVCACIPAMMLQILVENAIKHGISQLPDGGDLSIEIFRQDEQLICTVRNTGLLETNPPTAGFGVGLKTVTQRLKLLYPNNAEFNLSQAQTQVIAQLHLPFELHDESTNC